MECKTHAIATAQEKSTLYLNWYPFIVAILASLLIDYHLNVIKYMIACSVINRHLFYPHMPSKLSYRIHILSAIQHHLNITSHLHHVFSCCTLYPMSSYVAPNSISLFSSCYTNSLLFSAPATTTLSPSLTLHHTHHIALLQHIVSIANN